MIRAAGLRWDIEMEAYDKGETRVVLHVRPNARDELLRLSLKSNSEVEHTAADGLVIRLYVDRWKWLILLVLPPRADRATKACGHGVAPH